MPTVLITGGSGMIGSALSVALVDRGYGVIILTRNARKEKENANIRYAEWDPSKQSIDIKAITSAHHIIHLAGANVSDGRWTPKRKKEIINSRVKSGNLIVKVLQETPNLVETVISSSATGYYGEDKKDHPAFNETDPPGSDFLADVVQQWEAAIHPAASLQKRVVIFRTGIVLSNEGGAYAEFKKPLRFGLATVLGKGSQIISWIYIKDLVRLYIEAIENKSLRGIYNAVTPNPVSNRELILEMAKHQKIHLPVKVPSFALQAVLGEMSTEVLKSTTTSSAKIEAAGFRFEFPDIKKAVADLSGETLT